MLSFTSSFGLGTFVLALFTSFDGGEGLNYALIVGAELIVLIGRSTMLCHSCTQVGK